MQRDQRYDELKLAVADALAMWQMVELATEYLFRTLAQCKQDEFASIIFHQEFGTRNRLGFMRALFKYQVTDEHLKQKWKKVIGDI